MKRFCLIVSFFVLPLVLSAAERTLKIDKAGTFIDVDVNATSNFTAHLDAYDIKVNVDDGGKIKSAVFGFKFSDLKTGNTDRDAKMIEWLGGGSPEGRFELGNLAVTPDGQGQVSGRLTFHDVTERVEFPVSVVRANGVYTMTGETTIDYRNWKLKIIRMALVLKVNPEVRVRFKITATLPEPASK
jgi:polyisoprenoid-binding protein YceI